jgi:hypothetical protein
MRITFKPDFSVRAVIFLIALLPWASLAQETSVKPALKALPFTLKVAPLNLINSVQLSADLLADIPIKRRWGLEMGLGVLLDSETYAQYVGETYKGIKVKPTIKYYLDIATQQDIYIGLALKYNYIQNERFVRMFRQGQQYRETSLQLRQVHTWGAAFRFGAQLYSGKYKRFVFDPSLAFGARHSRVSYPSLPPDAELRTESEWFDLGRAPGSFWTLDILVGMSIGWAFN